MKIMVFDVAAESGGALSVLHDFYNEYKLEQQNEYIFIVSLPELKETSNIKVLCFPWIKKSWYHRMYFDHYVAPNLVKEYKVDQVLSLQNIIIPRTKVYQSVFVHNALPFSEYKFGFNENRLLWTYQNIIGRKIMKSIKRANHVTVQTEWMKKKCIEKLCVSGEKLEVKPPKMDIEVKEFFQETKESLSTFFYPASGVVFKNHKVIVDACLKLKENGITNYKVIFTLKGNENQHVEQLYKIIKMNELPIEFIGPIDKKKVFEYYTKAVLVFPSYIETVGLPLVEASQHNTPILASDCMFSHEMLDKYNNVSFFCHSSYNELFNLMIVSINKGAYCID